MNIFDRIGFCLFVVYFCIYLDMMFCEIYVRLNIIFMKENRLIWLFEYVFNLRVS